MFRVTPLTIREKHINLWKSMNQVAMNFKMIIWREHYRLWRSHYCLWRSHHCLVGSILVFASDNIGLLNAQGCQKKPVLKIIIKITWFKTKLPWFKLSTKKTRGYFFNHWFKTLNNGLHQLDSSMQVMQPPDSYLLR